MYSGDAVADVVAAAAVDGNAVAGVGVVVVDAGAAVDADVVVDAVADANGVSFACATVVYPLQGRNSHHPVCRSRSSKAGCPAGVAIAYTLHTPSDRTLEAPGAASVAEADNPVALSKSHSHHWTE